MLVFVNIIFIMETQEQETINPEPDTIFLEIYASCDVENANNVHVSALMKYIAPFIGTNTKHLEELRRLLNATNKAPLIDQSTFLNVMQVWTECKNETEVNARNNEEASQLNSNITSNKDNSDNATENFDRDLNVSGYSLTGSTISSTREINNWQEINQELQHHNKKLNESLMGVTNQISALEEQNESLHEELELVKKSWQSDQSLIKILQKKCSDFERDYEDNTNLSKKHLISTQSCKKEITQLQVRIQEVEQESKQYIDTITELRNLVSKEKDKNQYLQLEVEQRDLEIVVFQEKEIELKRQCSANELILKQFIQENEHLQGKVQSLEARLAKSSKDNITFQSEDNLETDSALTSEKPVNNSLSPDEDELFWGARLTISRPSSPHENLQSELIKIGNTDCLISCKHKLHLSQCKEEIEKLLMELDIKREEVSNLHIHKDKVEKELFKALDEIKTMGTKNTSTNSEIFNLEKKISHAEKLSCKLRKENNRISQRLTFYKNAFQNNISQFKEKNLELTDLKSELEKIKITGKEIETERQELHTKVSLLSNELKGKNEQFNKIEATFEQYMSQMALEKERILSIGGLLSEENAELKKEINSKKIKIEHLEINLHKHRKDVIDYKQKIHRSTEEIQNLNDRIENLKTNHKKISNDYESLISHINTATQVMKDNRGFLKMNTLLTTDIWKTVFKMLLPDQNIEEIMTVSVLYDGAKNINGPLQEEIIFLSNQIHQTVNILKALAKIRKKMKVSKTTNTSPASDLKCLLNFKNNANSSDNESIFSKLTPKRFFSKQPSPSLPRNSPLNPISPMSPECSTADMTDTPSGTASKPADSIETNNNEIPICIMAQIEEEKTAYQNGDLGSAKKDEAVIPSVSGENNIDRINDSKIEAILKQHRLQEPLEKIEESIILSPDDTESNKDYKSDSAFDDSENVANKGAKKKLKKGVRVDVEEDVKENLSRKYRSMSEGAVISHQVSADGDVTVFPNLKSETLDALGLLPNGQPKERLTDEEIEQKFQLLTLAFAIDAVTLGDRLERQQRQRDQAEDNLTREVTKFIQAVHRLNPLCVDAETTELVTSLLSHLDLIVQATHRISTSAEVFGSVQLEWRISDSVNMMIAHLRNVIQQRDTTRRQLQCTKHMLQETANSGIGDPLAMSTPRRSTLNNITAPVSGRAMTRRRASIATIPRPLDSPSASGPAGLTTTAKKTVARRVSAGVCGERVELSSKHLDFKPLPEWKKDRFSRPSLSKRPSRLEFGLDLSKIQEGSIETTANVYEDPMDSEDENLEFRTPSIEMPDSPFLANARNIFLQNVVIRKILHHVGPTLIPLWNRYVEDGSLHEICCLGACFCFAMATLLLCNLMVEIEFSRGGKQYTQVPWKWLTWEEIFSIFFTIDRHGPNPT